MIANIVEKKALNMHSMEDGNMTVGVTVSSLMEFIYRERGDQEAVLKVHRTTKNMSLILLGVENASLSRPESPPARATGAKP
jgi:hypothetical protein